ncbi:hypothetical protein FRB91_010342 [Serendipita sp. 411]|nr:hypothetical protein FRC18_011233 [Serendipita sp. 400]KAG8858125.1 hypothetical protein FRB91_010342 [Serendipita sp. 411]
MSFTHQLSQFPWYVQLPSATPRFTARPMTAIFHSPLSDDVVAGPGHDSSLICGSFPAFIHAIYIHCSLSNTPTLHSILHYSRHEQGEEKDEGRDLPTV